MLGPGDLYLRAALDDERAADAENRERHAEGYCCDPGCEGCARVRRLRRVHARTPRVNDAEWLNDNEGSDHGA